MGAQHLRSLFLPSSIRMPTATVKLKSESRCNAKRQPSFRSEILVISAVKALGSTFAMARTPSPGRRGDCYPE
jgi:hypothetical protein